MNISGRTIGGGAPCYVVAELSANHQRRFEVAVELVKAAAEAGVDAVKVQLYSPDTMTIDCDHEDFQIRTGLWQGVSLHTLYSHTAMPWEWYPELLSLADGLGVVLFPTVFDLSSLEFAEKYNTPAYKIASFEIGDLELRQAVIGTGKPVLVSLGCATRDDVVDFDELREAENLPILLLHCISEYPATVPSDFLSQVIPGEDGVSDHTPGIGLGILAAATGAAVVEKHIWTGKGDCADREFSLSPGEFATMVHGIRGVQSIPWRGDGECESEGESIFCRSVRAVRGINAGEKFTRENIRIIRPAGGADPRLYTAILGRKATAYLYAGDALHPADYGEDCGGEEEEGENTPS